MGMAAGSFSHDTAVVVGLAVEVCSTAVAGEQQGPTGWSGGQLWGQASP